MQIKYSKDVKSNIDLLKDEELRASILEVVKESIGDHHLDFSISSANDLYKNEVIRIVFKFKYFGLNANLVIITNYRIINIPQSTINTIIRGEQIDSDNIKNNILFIELNACQDNVYNGEYSLILKYRETDELIINGDSKGDSSFIKKNIKPLILGNNDKMVKAYNSLVEKADDLPFDVTSIIADPSEKTLQEIVTQKLKTENEDNNFEKQDQSADDEGLTEKINHKKITEPDDKPSVCHYSFGPAPKGYHQTDVVFAQGPSVNWISNNGNFVKGMQKALDELGSMLQDDELVCNMRFTTQNMGDTFAVNLAGDLYKKD